MASNPQLIRTLTIPLVAVIMGAALMQGLNRPSAPPDTAPGVVAHSSLLNVDLAGATKVTYQPGAGGLLLERAAALGLSCKSVPEPEVLTTRQPGMVLGRLKDAAGHQGRWWRRQTDGLWTAGGTPPLLIASGDGFILVCVLAKAISE